MKLLHEITMPNYPRKVRTALSRKTKYFKPNDKLPKRFYADITLTKLKPQYVFKEVVLSQTVNRTKKSFKSETRLFDTTKNESVIKNPRVAGTERFVIINGNYIYNGKYDPFTQGKIIEHIHNWMKPFLQALQPITEFPLYIECEVHEYKTDEIVGSRKWDVFNRAFPFTKSFEDVLQELGIIPGDDVDYIICPSHPIYKEITSGEPKLIFKIYAYNSQESNINV
jgi:hypothetical protein